MKILDGIRAVGSQMLRTTDEFGATIELSLNFHSAASEWFFNLTFGDIEINGMKLYNSLNVLWEYEKILTFGMAVIVSDGGEPFLINDLSGGRVQIAILTDDEAEEVTDLYITERIS